MVKVFVPGRCKSLCPACGVAFLALVCVGFDTDARLGSGSAAHAGEAGRRSTQGQSEGRGGESQGWRGVPGLRRRGCARGGCSIKG